MAAAFFAQATNSEQIEVVELKDAGHAPLDSRVNVAELLKDSFSGESVVGLAPLHSWAYTISGLSRIMS